MTRTGSLPGSAKMLDALLVLVARRAPSSRSTDTSVDAIAGIWTDWNADGSRELTGEGPAEPTIPGSATRARAAVSAAPATDSRGRTIPGPYRAGQPVVAGGTARCAG